ncbi:MAG: cobalamin-dependent protein [Yoonia sp.]|uniref:cobalamin-dependent protein n=1 Tax=Yoonia sp. TaxID=2212373 RepID=UPI003EFB271B
MADYRNVDAKTKADGAMALSGNPARRVALAVVDDITNSLDPDVLEKLNAAVLSPAPEDAVNAVKELVGNGVRPVDLADFYIPTIARKLGAHWCEDELSFAAVTIGTSRLQAMLRCLGPSWSGECDGRPNAPSVLVVVPHEIYHTLGAIVLSGQLRRKGLSVKLLLGGAPSAVSERVANTTYDAVFISSSRGESLESLRRIVDAVHAAIQDPPPIVIGGTILEVETAETITALTKADHATKYPDEAIRLCGLRIARQNALNRNGA